MLATNKCTAQWFVAVAAAFTGLSTPLARAQACEKDGSCDAGIACSSDQECPTPLICEGTHCAWEPVECTTDTECDPHYACAIDPMKKEKGACAPSTVPCEEGACAIQGWMCFDASDHPEVPPERAPQMPVCLPEGFIALLLGQAHAGGDEESAGTEPETSDGGSIKPAPEDSKTSSSKSAGNCAVTTTGRDRGAAWPLAFVSIVILAFRRRRVMASWRSRILLLGTAAAPTAQGCVGGQTGDAPGEVQCYVDSECRQSVSTSDIDALNRPGQSPAPFGGSTCEHATIPSDPSAALLIGSGPDVACTCNGETSSIESITLHGKTSECLVYKRSRECMYRASDFPGCDPEAPTTSCQTVCDDLARRLEDDVMRSYDARVRSLRCVHNNCALVVQIDQRCYANNSRNSFDCSLSDDEIIERDRDASVR